MFRKYVGALILLIFHFSYVCCQGPPKVTGSYKAYGEMVETLEDTSGLLTQIAFEESYDADTQNAALVAWVMGKNVTFIENFNTGQTYRYSENSVCELLPMDEWIKTRFPPSLMGYEDTNGTVRFSLKQLFALDNKYLKEKNLSTVYRGIPARKWMYEIQGKEDDGGRRLLNIYSYWSDGSWNTSSNQMTTPLGFTVSKMSYKSGRPTVKVHEQFINVFGFVPDTIERKLFEAIPGVVCPDRKQTLPFPFVNNWKAVAVHSELILPDYQEIRYVDTWFSPITRMVRVDLNRIKEEDPVSKSKKYQSEMISGMMGVVFRMSYDTGKINCDVLPFSKYESDIQTLINIKAPLPQWRMEKAMFGRNDTTYVYIGKTTRRDMPCHMFQGIRKDWPEASANITSLWEWCFNVNMTKEGDNVMFKNGEFGLVSAQIKILKTGKSADYPVGFRMIHHFYDVQVQDPNIMDATAFDINRCFTEKEKRPLQFAVNWPVTDDNLLLVENATSDASFLRLWKTAIYWYSGLPFSTLRISKVRSMVIDKKLYVKFTLLGVHSGLPLSEKNKQNSSFNVEETLRKNINNGKVVISYKPSKDSELLMLAVEKHSLRFQLNRTFTVHTLAPMPSTTPVSTRIFTLRTEPDSKTVSSASSKSPVPTKDSGSSQTTTKNGEVTSTLATPAPQKQENKKSNKHGPGTVAAVSITLLLIGLSIGSAGTFYKYNGLPPCLKGQG